jgi:hypothetical protein
MPPYQTFNYIIYHGVLSWAILLTLQTVLF